MRVTAIPRRNASRERAGVVPAVRSYQLRSGIIATKSAGRRKAYAVLSGVYSDIDKIFRYLCMEETGE